MKWIFNRGKSETYILFVLSFIFIAFNLIPSGESLYLSDGVIIGATSINNTYTSITNISLNSSIEVNTLGVKLDGVLLSYILTPTLNLSDLRGGMQNYLFLLNVTDGHLPPHTCYSSALGGYNSSTTNITNETCSFSFAFPQSSYNEINPSATSDYFLIEYDALRGVEVSLIDGVISRDYDIYSTLEKQYFLKPYNITNHLSDSYENVSFQSHSYHAEKDVNLSLGYNEVNGSYATNLIELEDFIISGTNFNISDGYGVVRYLTLNNTLSLSIPNFSIAIDLYKYDSDNPDTEVIEKQDGFSWDAQNSSRTEDNFAVVEFEGLSPADTDYYRYSYDAILAHYTGDLTSSHTLSGDYKEWTLDRNYTIHFNLTGKNLFGTIPRTQMGEWLSKISSWTTTLRNPDGSSKTHTKDDNIEYLSFSFSSAPLGDYPFQLKYYSLMGSSSTPSSGGGGGGGGGSYLPPSDTEDLSDEKIDKLIKDRLSVGKIRFIPTNLHSINMNYLPENQFYKEFMIEAYDGDVFVSLEFSENLKPYFTGGICDVRTSDCETSMLVKNGEQKYFFILGELQSEEFHEVIQEESLLQGYALLSNNEADAFFLNIGKSAIFDKVIVVQKDLTDRGFDFSTKQVYQIFVISTIILVFMVVLGYGYYARYI